MDPSLRKEMKSVYSTRRFCQDGGLISRIVVTWTLQDPLPTTFEYSFLPSLPPCEIRKFDNDQPSCYRCWGIRYISRCCQGVKRCAWCAESHDSSTCPHRISSQPPTDRDSTIQPPPPPPGVTTHWWCPRCTVVLVNE